MTPFVRRRLLNAGLISVSILVASCGGGGGGDSGGFIGAGGTVVPTTPTTNGDGAGVGLQISGTAARGLVLNGAGITATCANAAKVASSTGTAGTYTTSKVTFTYPCIGTATIGGLAYRSILFSGQIMNFTPLTDLLVEVVLAASAPGGTAYTFGQFIERASSDPTFAASVTSPTNTALYRRTVLNIIKAQLIASGKTEEEANRILADAENFDTAIFGAGSALDGVLDIIGPLVLDANGNVKPSVIAAAVAAGNLLPAPTGGATGGTGGTGATGATGS